MDISVTTPGDYAVLSPQGRLTAVGAPMLRKNVDRLLEEGSTRIVIDLSQTSFVDSSGLGALIGGLKAARVAGATSASRPPPPR